MPCMHGPVLSMCLLQPCSALPGSIQEPWHSLPVYYYPARGKMQLFHSPSQSSTFASFSLKIHAFLALRCPAGSWQACTRIKCILILSIMTYHTHKHANTYGTWCFQTERKPRLGGCINGITLIELQYSVDEMSLVPSRGTSNAATEETTASCKPQLRSASI
jgi:hypothetical protein